MSLSQWNTMQVELFKQHKLNLDEIINISKRLQPLRNKAYNESTRKMLDILIRIERELIMIANQRMGRNC